MTTTIDPKIYPTISRRLREAFTALGYDQYGGSKAAMERTGVGSAEMHYAVRAAKAISEGFLGRIEKGLGIRAEWLRTGDGDMLTDSPVRFERKPSKAKAVKERTVRIPEKKTPRASAAVAPLPAQALANDVVVVHRTGATKDPFEELQQCCEARARVTARIHELCAIIAAKGVAN